MAAWARQVLPGSRWLGKAYSYRLDVQGYAWLNLDAIDGHRGQRPGASQPPPPLGADAPLQPAAPAQPQRPRDADGRAGGPGFIPPARTAELGAQWRQR